MSTDDKRSMKNYPAFKELNLQEKEIVHVCGGGLKNLSLRITVGITKHVL